MRVACAYRSRAVSCRRRTHRHNAVDHRCLQRRPPGFGNLTPTSAGADSASRSTRQALFNARYRHGGSSHRSGLRRLDGAEPRAGCSRRQHCAEALVVRKLLRHGFQFERVHRAPMSLQTVRTGIDPYGFGYRFHGTSLRKDCIFIQSFELRLRFNFCGFTGSRCCDPRRGLAVGARPCDH